MEQKIKIIAIVLGVLCLISLSFVFLYINKYSSLNRDYKQSEREKEILHKENRILIKKRAEIQNELVEAQERERSLEDALDKADVQIEELRTKLTSLSTERNKLIEKLQKVLAASSQVEEKKRVTSAASDEYWAGILKAKSDLEVQLAGLGDVIRDNQIKIDELLKDKADVELELQKVTKEEEDMRRQVEYNERSADNLSLQLYKEKQDKNKLQEQLALLKNESSVLRTRLREAMNNKFSLEKKLKAVEDKYNELSSRMGHMDRVLQDKMSSITDVKQDLEYIAKGSASSSGPTVELPPIVVSEQTEMFAPVTPVSGYYSGGSVVNVNSESNFVILDIGENQGVRRGMSLHVWRGQNQIATLQVIQTRANASAADIKQKTSAIRVGDIVK